jgi:hypothetical protein
MNAARIGIIVLTILNIGLLVFTIRRMHMRLGAWRKVLASMPVPMLSFASSYGVYAYNLLFVPPWVAVVMAAAYDATFTGIAALDGLDPAQRNRGKRIAFWAAIISYSQNAIAGIVHAVPDVRAYLEAWPMLARVAMFGVGALLHAAQVWIAYHAADFTLHRPDAQAQPPKPATGATQVLQAKIAADLPPQVVYPAPTPVRRSFAENMAETEMPDLPPLPATAMDLTNQLGDFFGEVAQARKRGHGLPDAIGVVVAARAPRRKFAGQLTALPLPADDASADAKAAWVREMVDDRGWRQTQIADMMGCSRQWIGDLYHGRYKNKVIGGGK